MPDPLVPIVRSVRSTVMWFPAFASRIGWWKLGIAAAAVVIAGVAAHSFLTPATAVSTETALAPQVHVQSVAELSANVAPLSVLGTVTSRSEATVRAEKSGQITAVNSALGDYVAAGQIVAQFENASERAALTQAQGGLDAAQANLAKVQKGTRAEQLAILQAALDGAKSGAVNTLLSAYTSVDSAVRGTADTFMSGPETNTPHFNVRASSLQQLINIENERLALGPVLKREAQMSNTLSVSDDLSAELSNMQSEVRSVRNFLDDVLASLNSTSADPNYSAATIAGYVTSATTARTSINTTLASLTTALQTLQTAQKNLDQATTGAQTEDIQAAQAAVEEAQGSLAAARATLEKSNIRAPISGTINSLSLKTGDYVEATTPVLTVANNGSLEVVAYLSEEDAKQIAVGQLVTFDQGVTGTVTRVAPALDPLTKKIEVRIGVTDPQKKLVNGQSILATIARIAPNVKNGAALTIPISAIKVEADAVLVFTVKPDNTLLAHTVTLGPLLGDRVTIASGLSSDMLIVVDARGLRDGEAVLVH